MIKLSWSDVKSRARVVADCIAHEVSSDARLYGIPRGGIYAAQAIASTHSAFSLVESPEGADAVVDDIIDSGRTRNQWASYPFFSLVDKVTERLGEWVEFPWERMQQESGPEQNIVRILEYIGEDPQREGLRETPSRVVKSYKDLFGGYKQDPSKVMKVFEDGACDQMVLLKGIEFYSTCEHHMLPFAGLAHIAYIPNRRIVGISKLARVLEIYSRRLQVQERLCQQVTTALDQHLMPLGAACVLEARHSCMTCRGVGKQNSMMVTSSLTGEFREAAVRAEFFGLIRS